jgi:hypothetical protein
MYAVAGIVFLSVAGAFFLARNGWFAVGALGLAASYVNHFYLMTRVESAGTALEFAMGLGVVGTYFLVYSGAEFLAPESLRRGKVPFWFRNAFAVFNTLAFLALGTLLMDGYDFAEDRQHLFRYGLAAALLAFSVFYLRLRDADPLYNTYFVKGISAATWGLATQFDAHTLSMGLALETALLLFAARRNGLLVTRLLAFGVGVLGVGQALSSMIGAGSIAYGNADFARQAFEAVVIFLSFQFSAGLYRFTDWTARSPVRSPFGDDANETLWKLDLLAAPPQGRAGLAKPLNGLLYPYLFSIAGAVLGALHAMRLMATRDESVLLAAVALLLTAAAAALRMRPFGLAALVLFAAAVAAEAHALWDTPASRAVPALAMLGLVALAAETRYVGEREGLAVFRYRAMPYLLYGFLAQLVGMHFQKQIESDTGTVIGIGAAALAAAGLAIPLHRRALAWCGTGLLAWAQLRWLGGWAETPDAVYLAVVWALIALGFAYERYFAALGVVIAGPAALCVSVFTFASYIEFESGPGWVALWWTAGAGFALAYGAITRGKTAAALGVALLSAASLNQFSAALNWPLETTPLVAGFVAPALGWIACERAARFVTSRIGFARFDLRPVLPALPAIATALLAFMLFNLPLATTYYLTLSWSALGVVLFGLALAFGEKTYRYCGLGVLGLATARAAFIDTRQLEAMPRVFALGGLGLVLLALGYGYVRVFARTEKAPAAPD